MAITFRGNPTTPRKEWPNRATSLIVAIPSLLVTTLAPIPSTDVIRAPLIQQAKAWPEVRVEMRLGSPLPLVSAVPAPVVPAPHYPPARFWWQPQDASASVPKTLTADKQAPIFVGEAFFGAVQPRAQWLPADTSQSQSPLLKAIAAPFVPPSHYAPQQKTWLNGDSTRGTPPTLVAIVSAPFVSSPYFAAHRYPSLPSDKLSSQSVLLQVAGQVRAPVLSVQQTKPQLLANTSQGQSPVLKAISAPFVPMLHAVPAKSQWQPADTSVDTPKPAFSDAQPPVFVAPQFVADRVRSVANTTLGTPAPALSIPLPPGQFAFVGLQRTWWQPLDTSQIAPKVTYLDAVPAFVPAPHLQVQYLAPWLADTSQGQSAVLKPIAPFFPAPHYPPTRFWWQPTDTSAGTAKALTADKQAPTFNAPQFAIDRITPVTDTSQGSPLPDIRVPPPGAIAFVAAPRSLWQPLDASQSVPKTAFADTQAPVFDAPQFLVERGRPVVDTSHSTPVDLFAIALPPGQASFVGLQRAWWQPADTSASVPKPTYADKQSPTFIAPWLQVVRPPQVADTSQGSLSLVDTVAPIVPGPHLAPQRYPWLPTNTSASSGKVTYGDAVPAIVPPPHLAPQRYQSLPADTSRGIAKVAFGDAVPPFVALSYFAPQRYPSLPADTSRSDSVLLQAPTQNDLTGDVGALALTGIAGSIGQIVHLAGDVGTLVITGQAGSVDRQDNQLLDGSVGSLVLSGVAGVIQQSDNLAGDSGSLLLTGLAGSIQQNTTLAGAVGSLVLTGQVGSVDRQDNQFLAGAVGALSLTGVAGAIDVSSGTILVGDVGQLALTGIAGAVDQTQNQYLAGAVGSLSLTGLAGSIPSAGQDIIVGPSRPFFVEPIRLRLVLATIRTAQVQTVRGHGLVDVRAEIRTAQASQSVRADASARVDAEANTSQLNRSEAFGDARIRVSIVSQQSAGIYELTASALIRGEVTSGLFAADVPPKYDGPEDDDILPDLTRKAT